MAEPFVTIRHPDVDGEATVALSAVPGHAARGWLVVDSITATEATPAAPHLTRPPANAATDVWRTYAVAAYVLGAARGLTYETAMASSRDELAAHFADQPDLLTDQPTDTDADPADPQES